jgi:Transglycosylase SLT domain
MESHMGRLKLVAIAALAISIALPVQAKKPKEELPPSCPIDGTLRTADPKLLERFTSLAGCSEQVLVAPATPSDYVDPDGTVIIGSDRNGRSERSQEAAYNLTYASAVPTIIEDEAGDQNGRPGKKSKLGKVKDKATKGAKTEYYSYGASSNAPNLSGTGIAVRIVPEPQPVPTYAAVPQAGAPSFSGAAGPDDMSILSMRPQSFRTRYDDLISSVAATHRIDPLFLHAVIYQESRYRSTAVSHAGATGLMQIMPGTGRMLGVHPRHLTDPTTNVDAGARLLRKLHGKYGDNFELILAAYNAGEGAVAKYGNAVPPYRETRDYVKKVMARYTELLAEQNGVAPQK